MVYVGGRLESSLGKNYIPLRIHGNARIWATQTWRTHLLPSCRLTHRLQMQNQEDYDKGAKYLAGWRISMDYCVTHTFLQEILSGFARNGTFLSCVMLIGQRLRHGYLTDQRSELGHLLPFVEMLSKGTVQISNQCKSGPEVIALNVKSFSLRSGMQVQIFLVLNHLRSDSSLISGYKNYVRLLIRSETVVSTHL